jgi:NitT/TauT family transport system substrate-binding protein
MNMPSSIPADTVNKRRRAALGALGVLPLLGLGALSVKMVSSSGGGRDAARIRVDHQLGWLKGVQFGGDFAAQERGFFAQEGLDVSYTAGGPGTDYRTLVASGRSMISESNTAGMIDGYLRGQPIVAFAAVMQRDPGCIISSAARPINSLHDMLGKTIGVPGSIRSQLLTLFKRAQIDAEAVRLVPVGSDPSLLASGQVDAYYNWSTTAVPALRAAHFEPHLLHMADIGAPGYGQVLIAHHDTLRDHHDVLVRYTRALIKGWAWMIQHPRDCAELVVRKYAPPGTNLAEQIAQAEMMTPYIWRDDARSKGLLWIEPGVFETAAQLSREAGNFPAEKAFEVSQIVTQSVVRAAHSAA